MRGSALMVASLLLIACASQGTASRTPSADYVRQFNAIYNDRQVAYDKAFQALGSIQPGDASPDQLRTLFAALSHADYDFLKGLGNVTSPENVDSLCQSGAFTWNISFPVNDCPDVAALWKAAYSLASDEAAIANIDGKLDLGRDRETSDISKVSAELDRWRTAANKVRQDIGLPTQSFGVVGVCLFATTC